MCVCVCTHTHTHRFYGNALQQPKRTRHSRPRKTKVVFDFPSRNRFFPPHTHHHSPLGTLILPACFGLVCSKRVATEAERESERDRECAVLTSEETLTAVAWGVYGVVWSWSAEEGAERRLPTTPNTNQDDLPAWCVHRRPDGLKILQGDQQLSTTLRKL